MREKGRDTGRGRNSHSPPTPPFPGGGPAVGLNPRIPGSRSEPKADAQPLSHPTTPVHKIYHKSIFYSLIVNRITCSHIFFSLLIKVNFVVKCTDRRYTVWWDLIITYGLVTPTPSLSKYRKFFYFVSLSGHFFFYPSLCPKWKSFFLGQGLQAVYSDWRLWG